MLEPKLLTFSYRFGSADLCFQQTNFLIDLWLDLGSPISNSILLLVGRLIKFLAPEHQVCPILYIGKGHDFVVLQ